MVVKPRIGTLKEDKPDYEIGGHPYRNYVLKYENKRPFGDLHLDRIRSTILELHAVRYEALFWVQFPEGKFDEVLSP